MKFLIDANVDQANLILANLPTVLDDLAAGDVVSLSTTRLRLRSVDRHW
jgi:hypothetical protein